MSSATLLSIPLSTIQVSPYQARKTFDAEALQGLADSMQHEGLIEPVIVRQVGENTYELIAGERRVRAAKILGWENIEARKIVTSSEAEAAAKGLIENIQRENLNPIEEAEGFRLLNQLDSKYWNQEKISQIAGKSTTYVNRSLSLLDLPNEIQDYLRARKFSRSHGVELSRLATPEQQLEIARKIKDRLTWEETRSLINSILNPTKKPGASESVDPLQAAWDSILQVNWGVSYGSVDGQKDKLGWRFWTAPQQGTQEDLARWFRQMAEALSASQAEPLPMETAIARLPENQRDEARIEELAINGPSAVYAWVYGQDSVLAQRTKDKTWEQLGYKGSDLQAARQLIHDLRQQPGRP